MYRKRYWRPLYIPGDRCWKTNALCMDGLKYPEGIARPLEENVKNSHTNVTKMLLSLWMRLLEYNNQLTDGALKGSINTEKHLCLC